MSLKGEHWQHKVGAVIIKKNRIIGLGFNRMKTHPRSPHDYKFLHGEVDAILDCKREDLAGASIYVYREHKNGDLALSKPCKSCMNMLELLEVRDIFYTIEDGYQHLRLK